MTENQSFFFISALLICLLSLSYHVKAALSIFCSKMFLSDSTLLQTPVLSNLFLHDTFLLLHFIDSIFRNHKTLKVISFQLAIMFAIFLLLVNITKKKIQSLVFYKTIHFTISHYSCVCSSWYLPRLESPRELLHSWAACK